MDQQNGDHFALWRLPWVRPNAGLLANAHGRETWVASLVFAFPALRGRAVPAAHRSARRAQTRQTVMARPIPPESSHASDRWKLDLSVPVESCAARGGLSPVKRLEKNGWSVGSDDAAIPRPCFDPGTRHLPGHVPLVRALSNTTGAKPRTFLRTILQVSHGIQMYTAWDESVSFSSGKPERNQMFFLVTRVTYKFSCTDSRQRLPTPNFLAGSRPGQDMSGQTYERGKTKKWQLNDDVSSYTEICGRIFNSSCHNNAYDVIGRPCFVLLVESLKHYEAKLYHLVVRELETHSQCHRKPAT